MIWYLLLIPLIISGVGYFFFQKKIQIWELFIPTILSTIVILISYYSLKSSTLSDIEYNGYVIVEARYYESWETWVDSECSRSVACGTDSNDQTIYCTEYYDCSYCDSHSEYYEMIDSGGHIISIDRTKYLQLQAKWNATPKFNDLKRDIEYRDGFFEKCGKDGDMYSISWDKQILTSETSTYQKPFTNILKCNHSAFNYPEINEEKAKQAGLYAYPTLSGVYQNSILGLDKINIPNKEQVKIKLNYLNGYLGAKNKVRVFTILFKDKPIDVAFLQEAFWDGGNQNELIVCIGVDNVGNINWVKPFSWCDNKRIIVDTREDISELKKFNVDEIYNIYNKNIQEFWHYKSFDDFNYLSFEPTSSQLKWVAIIILIISILSFFWTAHNEFED